VGDDKQPAQAVGEGQTNLAGVDAGTPSGTTAPKRDRLTEVVAEIELIDRETAETVERIGKLYGVERSYALITGIEGETVDTAFDALRPKDGAPELTRSLAVVVDSPGGDIHSAYNLACLFRRYATERLLFIVPRWAKSAATLLVCGGDVVAMTPVAELGPLDPQLSVYDGTEGRHENFSPLHIESTLELIRQEFETGDRDLAEALVRRLQFPMTLGSYTKLLEVGEDYARKLLGSRMFKQKTGGKDTSKIAKNIVKGYPDHGCCIHCEEADGIGLRVELVPTGPKLDAVWSINRLMRRRDKLDDERKRLEMSRDIKNLPPELLDRLPGTPDAFDGAGRNRRAEDRGVRR